MRKVIRAGAAAAVVGLGAVGSVQGQAVKFSTGPGATGHWYQYVNTLASWTDARAAAAVMTLNAPGDPLDGAPGHLVTLGSAAEQAFVIGLGGGDRWIGLTDDPAFGGTEFGATVSQPYPAAGQTPASTPGVQRGEGWVWVTGEPLVFQSWSGSEPNQFSGTPENYADLNTGGTWTDRLVNAEGGRRYVVEYSAIPEPATAALLAIGGGGLMLRRSRRRR